MTITSPEFILFIIGVVLVYFLIPKKHQWVVLLASSIIFYCFGRASDFLYVIFTSVTIFFATNFMQKLLEKNKKYISEHKESLSKEDKKALKEKTKKKRKLIMVITLIANLFLLCLFKYSHFALAQLNSILVLASVNPIADKINLISPLGISFYTFQSIGYLADVYWEYYKPEKNYFKVLLFVSFFPQMTQGPISDFEGLSKELFSEHTFKYERFSYGARRMIWGFTKKLFVANMLGHLVNDVFASYHAYSGPVALIAMFSYSIQIYADFSGYMDIMCGFCEILGIKLKENFDRPYFSMSIAEYWRRWHITLGDWFKKYIYYPMGISNFSRNIGKALKPKLGKHIADTVPATIALIVVWFCTGLWHGASWEYILWGLFNGLFIILSLWMEPLYQKLRTFFKINTESRWWKVFCIIRTFILVTFIKVFPEVGGGAARGFGIWKHVFTGPVKCENITQFIYRPLIVLPVVAIMFAVSVMQDRKPVRKLIDKVPLAVRIIGEAVIIMLVVSCGYYIMYKFGEIGFLYEGF